MTETLTAEPETESPPVLMIAAKDLSIRYRPHGASPAAQAVNGATFDLFTGEILAVIGESGSGKSSLARVIAGHGDLNSPGAPQISGGEISVLGVHLRRVDSHSRYWLHSNVGYLEQSAGGNLHPHLTVGESIAEPIYERDRKFSQRLAGMAVATLIDAVRLPMSMMNKFPHELSAGQRQRVAIARALILEPVLLVADDLTAGVDVTARQPILDIIRELQSERSFSAFIVTSNLWEVESISNLVLVMYRGVVVGRGAIEDVLHNPQHPYTQQLAYTRTLDRPQEDPIVD
jgi:peptide/nickel transport system ATP-binding protein